MNQEPRHIIIGTSGHIDHGKSALVKALTGTDPDRFQEEKERGMTIDLGYAFYSDRIAFIDVPGHERFIKNMVAGVSTIDLVLFVVAADDGVMPQTREHLDILRVLGVDRGIIVITKIDLVELEWLQLVEEEIRDLVRDTFLRAAPIIKVSTVTLEGLDELRQAIDRVAAGAGSRPDRGYFWMPVDRSFSIQGFGTVVTGSVLSGVVKVGEELELLPPARMVKVRGLQRHGSHSETVHIGDRAAVNLQGIHREQIKRGDVLVTPGYGVATTRMDVQLHLLPGSPWPVKDQDRLRLHVGTSEVFARTRLLDSKQLNAGDSGFVQLMLEKPVAVNRGDRFVVRKYSPLVTIGGGLILDHSPFTRHHRFDEQVLQHFQILWDGNLEALIREYLRTSRNPRTGREIARVVSSAEDRIQQALHQLWQSQQIIRISSGPKILYLAKMEFHALKEKVLKTVEEFHRHHPHLPGIGRAELSSRIGKNLNAALLDACVEALIAEKTLRQKGDLLFHAEFSAELKPEQEVFYQQLIQYLTSFGYTPPSLNEIYQKFSSQKKLLDILIPYGKSRNELVTLSNGLVYPGSILEEMKEMIRNHLGKHSSITAADFRDLIQASRKYAVSILEYFDEIGFTRREGDARFLT